MKVFTVLQQENAAPVQRNWTTKGKRSKKGTKEVRKLHNGEQSKHE